MLRLGAVPRLAIGSRSFVCSRIVNFQTRTYAKGRSLVRQKKPSTQRDTWVDPFKAPPHPKPDLRVLIRPAIFTVVVLLSADYIADHFVNKRTSQVTTRAERNSETNWTIIPIIGVNVVIFGLWHVFPSFLHRIGGLLVPYAPTPSQLVVNTFSHQEVWHLALNQVAFYSFGSLVCDTVGREHFLALYLQAACVSSLASASATQFFVSRGIYDVSTLSRGSLGASGVIYSMLGISAMVYPEMGVGIILLPFSFPIKYAFPTLCAVDTAGIIFRWSRFDHVAHVLLSVLKNKLIILVVGWSWIWYCLRL